MVMMGARRRWVPSSFRHGLAGAWPLTEYSGTRQDWSGRGTHLTDNGGVTQVAGPYGGFAAHTATATAYLSVTDNPTLTFPGSFGFSGWLRITADPGGGGRGILGKWAIAGANQAGDEFILYAAGFSPTIGFQWTVRQSDGTAKSATSAASFSTNAWHYLAGWFDSPGALIGLQIDATTPTTTAVTTTAIDSGTQALFLGSWDNSGGNANAITADLWEWLLWNDRAPSAQDRATLYAVGLAGARALGI